MAVDYSMPTTVQVSEDTLSRMKEAKAERRAKTYDELIRRLLRDAVPRKSPRGAHPEMRPFEHGRTGHSD